MNKPITSLQQLQERKFAVRQILTEKEHRFITVFHNISRPFELIVSLFTSKNDNNNEGQSFLKKGLAMLPYVLKLTITAIDAYKTRKRKSCDGTNA
jgi:hypothetical protein